MPHLSATERAILRASENKDMFEEKFLPFENNQGENGAKGSGNADKSSTEASEKRLKRGTYINLSSRELMSNLNSKNKDRHFFETSVVYNEIKLPIRVPLTVMPEEVGDVSIIIVRGKKCGVCLWAVLSTAVSVFCAWCHSATII